MDDRAIGLIGLMRRAGAIEIGEDNSGSAVSAGKAKLLLTAADASENALRHAERFTQRAMDFPADKLVWDVDNCPAALHAR